MWSTRRPFFLIAAVTAVGLIPVFLDLREQQSPTVEEANLRLGHDRSLLVVELHHKDSGREGHRERDEGGVGGEQDVPVGDGAASNVSKEHGTVTTSLDAHISKLQKKALHLLANNTLTQEGSDRPPVDLEREKSLKFQEPFTAIPKRETTLQETVVKNALTQELSNRPIKPVYPRRVVRVVDSNKPVDPKRVVYSKIIVDTKTEKPMEPWKQPSQKATYKVSETVAQGAPEKRTVQQVVQDRDVKWQPISQKTFKYNRTLEVKFPKIDRLYSRTPCKLKNETHNSESSPWRQNRQEVIQVRENLQKCLEAAELTQYFEKMNYISTSNKNAALFLMRVRDVVPASFSASHGNTSCWKSQFDLSLCTDRVIEGHINHHPYAFSGHLLTPELQRVLHYSYAGKVSSHVTCLPSVFVAGFPKCGSSFVYCLIRRLYQYKMWKFLVTQPEKEPHFWVPGGPVYHHHKPHNLGDISRYMLNFIPRLVGNHSVSFPIDASPNTMFQWPRYSTHESLENYCLVPSILPIILPHTKYVVVLRDPITMLYSAFWFSTSTFCPTLSRSNQVLAPDDFHLKVVRKINAFNICRRSKPVDACLEVLYPPVRGYLSYATALCGRVRLEVGFYYHYIRRWLAVIPRKQFLFLTTDELGDAFHGVSQQLSDFLGLGLDMRRPIATTEDDSNCKNVQSMFDYRKDPQLQMRDKTRKLLYEFFDPMNRKLAELLQDSKFHWKPPQ